MEKRTKNRVEYDGIINGDWLEGFGLSFNGFGNQIEIELRHVEYKRNKSVHHPFMPQDRVKVIIKKVKQ